MARAGRAQAGPGAPQAAALGRGHLPLGAVKKDISQAGTLRYNPVSRKGKVSKSRKTIYNFTHSAPGNPPYKQQGHLRRSIAWEIVNRGEAITARVGTNLLYGRYLELGTRRMKARPFLRRALAQHQAAIRRIVAGNAAGANLLGSFASNQSRAGIIGRGGRKAGF